MLCCTGAWLANIWQPDEWIKADLGSTHRVLSVTTRGAASSASKGISNKFCPLVVPV